MAEPCEDGALPPDLVRNMKNMFNEHPERTYDLGELGRLYFSVFKTFVYPERYGLRSWEDILRHPQLRDYCELFNSNMTVRPRRNPPAQQASHSQSLASSDARRSVMPSPSNVTSKTAAKRSMNGGEPSTQKRDCIDGDSMATSDDSYVTEVPLAITPLNLAKLARERNKIMWIPRERGAPPLTFSILIMERIIEPDRPITYIDCTYCDRNTLEKLMDVKGYIKRVSADRFANLRNRFNEFEFDRGAIFHHGAAIKLANIDALTGYALTNPKDSRGTNLVGPNELLYFVDMYGGPGGFPEYVLWKKKWEAKGFGISPRGSLDYNLFQAEHYPRESFEPFYGENGVDGNGDICKPYNLARFVQFIRECTNGRGVHFACASGGDRNDYVDEDQKELRCKYLFMAEFLCALQVVREGGHYVARFYDMYTPFTVGLIYLMYRCFDQIAVLKPESALPAGSERYVICKWRKSDYHTREIINYLSECHKVDWLAKRGRRMEEQADIIHLVSRERIKGNLGFCEYMFNVNTDLGKRQYADTKNLVERIQEEDEMRYVEQRLRSIQQSCVDFWGIPRTTRQKPKYAKATTADLRAKKLILPYSFDFFRDSELSGEMELTITTMGEDIKRPKEWSFMAVGKSRGFFLCLGGTSIFQFGGAMWTQVNEKIELMNNTLVYADMVDEVKMNGAAQSITTGFHIIDALILGGNDIRNMPANERYDLISKYALSMNKESRPDLATIRAKPRYEMKDFAKFMDRIGESERIRSYDGDTGSKFLAPVGSKADDGLVYCPAGLMLMKVYKENFAPADVRFCVANRLFWRWSPDTDLNPRPSRPVDRDGDVIMGDDEDEDKKNCVSASMIISHLQQLGIS